MDNKEISLKIEELLSSLERITGLDICYHDHLQSLTLSKVKQDHLSDKCLETKEEHRLDCVSFCGASGEVDRKILSHAEGWIHTCPFGVRKIAVGINHDAGLAGVIFATVSPQDYGKPGAWFEDRRRMIYATACTIEKLLNQGQPRELSRRQLIMRYLNNHLSERVRLQDLAIELKLSPSRTSNVVKTIFKLSFSQLHNMTRMQRAAVLISSTDLPLSDIALQVGYYDQSHFTHAFKKQFNCKPGIFRDNAQKNL